MSHHHHHPHEGHTSGNPRGTHMRHNWFFYLAGVMIFIGLIAFIIAGSFRSTAPITNPTPVQTDAR
jgi:hypothetical protein